MTHFNMGLSWCRAVRELELVDDALTFESFNNKGLHPFPVLF